MMTYIDTILEDGEQFMGANGQPIRKINHSKSTTFYTTADSGEDNGGGSQKNKIPYKINLNEEWQNFTLPLSQVVSLALEHLRNDYFAHMKKDARKQRKSSFMSLLSQPHEEDCPQGKIRARQSTTITQQFRNLWRQQSVSKDVQSSSPYNTGKADQSLISTNDNIDVRSRRKLSQVLGLVDTTADDSLNSAGSSLSLKRSNSIKKQSGHRRHHSHSFTLSNGDSSLNHSQKKELTRTLSVNRERRWSVVESIFSVTNPSVDGRGKTRTLSLDSRQFNLSGVSDLPVAQVSDNVVAYGVMGSSRNSIQMDNAKQSSPIASIQRQHKLPVARSLILKALIMLETGSSLQSVLGDPKSLYYHTFNIKDITQQISEEFMNHRKADSVFLQEYVESSISGQRSSVKSSNQIALLLVEIACSICGSYDLAQFLVVSLKQYQSWMLWENDIRRLALNDDILSLISLEYWYRSMVELQNENLLNESDLQLLIHRDAAGLPDGLKSIHWDYLECIADHSTMPKASYCFTLAQGYLHDKSMKNLIPNDVKRDKVMAAKYFRKAFSLGYQVPDAYMRWIWKHKYQVM
ncbi:hypothetical protein MIR68_012384 [Amoeboaphelidium protococcarum]|nr:hypothetical protein MIR68_012384 [Amoeboaphelidium protococcarum]